MAGTGLLQGKNVIITGSARGIGEEYARGLAKAGASLALCDRNGGQLEETAHRLREQTGAAVVCREVDVTDEQQVDAFTASVLEQYGRIDGLVNNAGVLLRRKPEEMSREEWEFIMGVNVTGTFLFSKSVGKVMIGQRKGSIVNIASIGARQALSLRAAYCTSKAAVEHLTRCLAFEWGQHGVRVNAIAPGYTATDMNADLRSDPAVYARMVSEVPLGRFGMPADLVGTLVFLLSEASEYVSGQTIYVDGGKTTV